MRVETFVLLASALTGLAQAQSDTCARLKDYSLAQQQCSQSYPVPIPTVTSITTTTVRGGATTTSSTTPSTTTKTTTTSAPAYNNGRTRTVTAFEEVTVTDCRAAYSLQCPFNHGAGNGLSSPSTGSMDSSAQRTTSTSAPSRPTNVRGYRGPREAEPEPMPQPFGFSRNAGFSDFWNMFLWLSVKAQGTHAVKDMCACILPSASKTVTVSEHDSLRYEH